MIKNEEKKTTVKMRIVIALVALFTLGSTFALYAGIVLNYSNGSATSAERSEKEKRFNELYQEYLAQADAQADELSNKYFDSFVKYKSNVKAFNASDAQAGLEKKDLVKGSGEKITYKTDENGNITGLNTEYSAYYIGWLPDETIFDSSFNDPKNPSSLAAPLSGSLGLIQGWIEGIEGMRIGGVREITIPSALGYGAEGSGSAIPADTPLKFIVMVIDPVEEIEPSEELNQLINELYM